MKITNISNDIKSKPKFWNDKLYVEMIRKKSFNIFWHRMWDKLCGCDYIDVKLFLLPLRKTDVELHKLKR